MQVFLCSRVGWEVVILKLPLAGFYVWNPGMGSDLQVNDPTPYRGAGGKIRALPGCMIGFEYDK